LKSVKSYLPLLLLFVAPSYLYAQGGDELYQNYLKSRALKSTTAQDTQIIKDYAAYVVYQINDGAASVEKMLDTLADLTANSRWPKSLGIQKRVEARYYERQGDMDRGLQLYNQAIDTLRNAGPSYQDLSTALIGSGFVLLNSQLHDEAFKILQEGYQYAQSSGHLNNQLLTLNFFGDFYYYSAYRKENFDSALYYYQATERLIDTLGTWGYYKSDNDLGLANVYRRLGKKELSEMYFQRSLKEAEQYKNYGVIYALYVDKAEIYEEQGDFNQALELKLEAYEYVQASGWVEFIARADLQFYYTYKSLGNYEHALMHYERYIAAQDSMKKQEATARYAELEAKYESKEKEDEIIRLQNKNLQQSRDFLLGLAGLGGLLLGFISWLNWRLRNKNKELERKNKEILLAQLRGQNLERKRMAVELHDNLNTKIAAIRWQLEAVNPSVNEKAQNILNSTLKLVNDVYGDVRLISHNLMPEKVEALGLVPALKELLFQLKQNNKINFNLVVNTPPDFQFGSLTYHIYNIIMEMINNILKHAEAENGWISLSRDDNKILLTVSDDGKGFEIGEMTNGFGIRNITSRLENINGKWNIESSPGKGTKFYIEIPQLD